MNTKTLLNILFVLNIYLFLNSLLSLILPYWLIIKNYRYEGLFQYQNISSHYHPTSTDTTTLFNIYCNDYNSDLQCSYLYATQISTVVTFILSFFTTIAFYYAFYSNENRIKSYINNINLLYTSNLRFFFFHLVYISYFLFGLLALIFYGVYSDSYYPSADDINREYSTDFPSKNDVELSGVYYFYLSGVAFTFFIVLYNFYNYYTYSKQKKNTLDI